GYPLIKTANWLSHLEFDAESPVWGHWLRELARDHRLVRYDSRGCGLSDWDVELSMDAWLLDLEAVVDHLGLERFALLGISAGGAIAIEYAARHPDRVSQVILHGAFAKGWALREISPEAAEKFAAIRTLMAAGWGRSNPAFRQIFSTAFIPDGSPEQSDWFNELQRVSTSPDIAVRFYDAYATLDVTSSLSAVNAPTLLFHARGDAIVPFKLCREIAAGITDRRVVQLDSRNHLLIEPEPAWPVFLHEARRFLDVETRDPRESLPGPLRRTDEPSVETGMPAAEWPDFWTAAAARIRTRFDLIRRIGRGGMASVYLALDRKHDRPVALKVFDQGELGDIGAKRFRREILVTSGLQHPHILPLLDSGTLGDRLFYAMPFVDGPTLSERLRDPEPIPRSEVVRIAREVAGALDYAHGRGVIHRDIKPGNILFSAGHAVVADFGIAHIAHAHSGTLTSGSLIGTPSYMSPEQLSGAAVDHRTDIYSLACVVYELFAGRPPFTGTVHEILGAHLGGDAAPLSRHRPDVAPEITRCVTTGLAKAPDDRYESASEFASALGEAVDL
ncbi:MAG: alpha/beta fold hydrolase, partial [Gemmatimonadetes bacterium]|nr:alpha/beta fold hydrolase [Gemmatimonadota bacterium]